MILSSRPPSSLNGVRVLVTRPQQQAGKWCQLLAAKGADTLAIPLMAIEPLTQAAEQQAIQASVAQLNHYQHAIFVSQNAVHYGMEWLAQHCPNLPENLHCYAVGSATAKALESHGWNLAHGATSAMNSEALLALPSLQSVSGASVLIFRGQGGRPLLADVLVQRGAKVDYCELYRRVVPASASAALGASDFGTRGQEDWVSLHSGETLQNWYNMLLALERRDWLDQPILVPGQRVADQAKALGFGHIVKAENAADDTMLQTLLMALGSPTGKP